MTTAAKVERRDARRQELLAAARALVAEDGLAGLTVHALARRLGVAVGGLYRYVPGKSGLLVLLQEEALEGLAAEVAAAVDASRLVAARRQVADPRAAALSHLLAALGPVLAGPHLDPVRHRLLDGALSAPEQLLAEDELARVNAALRPLLGRFEALLHEAALAGALAPGAADERTRLLWAAVHGLGHFRKRDRAEPARLRVDRLAPALLRTLLVGFGGEPAVVDAALRAAGLGPRAKP